MKNKIEEILELENSMPEIEFAAHITNAIQIKTGENL